MKAHRVEPALSSVRASVKKRGKASYNLWSVWSPKTRRNWMIKSDLCEEHWLLLEADANVESFELCPELVGNEPSERRSELGGVDAVVHFGTGRMEWRSVKFGTELRTDDPPLLSADNPNDTSFARCVVTETFLARYGLLIENFRRVVAALARTSDFPPVAEQNHVASVLRHEGRVVLGDLIAGLDPLRAAMMLSGSFALLTNGFARSDLDAARLSTRTQLWIRE